MADGERLAVLPHLAGLDALSFAICIEEIAQAWSRETNGALLAIKLNNIVAINGMHGRTGGDEALRAVAYVLTNYRASAGHESHVVFKFGGPVFGYYVPSCTAAQARLCAEEIHRLVMQSELYLDRLTVSIGVANFHEFFMEEGSREQLALRVEQAAFHRMAIAEQQGASTICDTSEIDAQTVSRQPVVLLVEPDPGSMELLIRALEAADLAVHVCEEGESAIAFVQASPPAVIICEAMTPRVNGFTIRERLRTSALWNAIPFILVSHKKNEELLRKAVEHDIRHFFRKPVSLTEVVGLVTNITRSAYK